REAASRARARAPAPAATAAAQRTAHRGAGAARLRAAAMGGRPWLERADLQRAQELLFALPPAGEADEARWGQRIWRKHFRAVASSLRERLERAGDAEHGRCEEGCLAKLQLLDVVAERFLGEPAGHAERARELDPALADAMARLRAHEADLFRAALRLAPAGGELSLGPAGGAGGVLACAAARPAAAPLGSAEPALAEPAAPRGSRGERGRGLLRLGVAGLCSGAQGRTIRALYLSKQEHDRQALPTDRPETMERHLFRYLGERHRGQEARDRAAAIVSAVQKYAGKDVEVAIFGKILQNRLPEQPFIHVDVIQEHVEEKLGEFLRQDPQYREALPREGAMKDLRRCGVPLECCVGIAQDMYDEKDYELVMRRLGQLVPRIAEARAQGNGKFLVPFKSFLQSLQLVWVHRRECQLQRFARVFGELDQDGDGVLSGGEVQDLAARLADAERSAPADGASDCDEESQEAEEAIIAELQAACGELLPELQGCRGATFSQCVEMFRDVISLCHSLDELQASLRCGA
ncbi:unnamed protein product, partial [Prorocentrum cordatum]